MLVPTAAMPFLKNNNNQAEFVIVGDLAFVIRLNERFDLLNSGQCDARRPIELRNTLGDSNRITKLCPYSIEKGYPPANSCEKIKCINGDRILVIDNSVSVVDLQFLFGIYLVIIFLVCGFSPGILILFGVMGGFFYESINAAREVFLHTLPYGIFIAGTLPFAVIWWVSVRILPPRETVLIFDRSNRSALFYESKLKKKIWVEWERIYSVVESAEWTTSYGFPIKEVFLELASDNRDCKGRAVARLNHSAESDAFGLWRAIQEFMNGNLHSLEFDSEESDKGGSKCPRARVTGESTERLRNGSGSEIYRKPCASSCVILLAVPFHTG